MRRLLFFLLGVLLINAQLLAQNRTVTGKVTDENGNPIEGASVLIKGQQRGVVTKADGTFSITVPENVNSLTISSVSFGTQTVTIGSGSLAVQLKKTTDPMDEVVVVGYQTRKKRD